MHKLVIKAQSGDKNAFGELIFACKQDMYRVAKGFFRSDDDAADAIGEAVLSCYEHLHELREPRYFKTWLTRILINKCKDLIQSGAGYVALEEVPEPYAEDQASANVEFMMLMDTLDEQYRVVLILHYAQGLRVREISEVTGVSESAVKARLRRGREKVKKLYSLQKLEVLP